MTELKQKLQDQTKQMRAYKVWKKAEFDSMLAQHGDNWRAFTKAVRALSMEGNAANFLVGHEWLYEADRRTRQLALAYLANRLIMLRLEDGRAPMDDSLPGEEMTLFEIIREKLKVLT